MQKLAQVVLVQPEMERGSADLPFRSAAFHPESCLSFSNPRTPINGRECAIVSKPNGLHRNGRRRRYTAKIYAPAARGTRPKSRGTCEAAPCLLPDGRRGATHLYAMPCGGRRYNLPRHYILQSSIGVRPAGHEQRRVGRDLPYSAVRKLVIVFRGYSENMKAAVT